mgnify:FL=1|jgi:hypothetical protein
MNHVDVVLVNVNKGREKMKMKEWICAGIGWVVGFLCAAICAANGILTY